MGGPRAVQRAGAMLAVLCAVCAIDATASPVWPPPQSLRLSGEAVGIAADVVVKASLPSARLARGIERYTAVIRAAATQAARDAPKSPAATIRHVVVSVENSSERLHIGTAYNYTLRVSARTGAAEIAAGSVYGALYGLETLAQLIDRETGVIPQGEVWVRDAPDYPWRGLMLDAGRRFFPMASIKDLLTTMATSKLNVLHLHASDMCRFGVESKRHPNLTAALTGIHGGFYTQEDIAEMIAFAKDRGIRVVPEFDIPGHSRGWLPLESEGLKFCSDAASRSQLYNDPANATYKIVYDVLEEMTGLFEDEVFNIGCDETSVKGPCSLPSTFALERAILNDIQNKFNKTAEGWEEVLFDAGAATNRTIVNAWARHTASEITATGREAVESSGKHFYFTQAAKGGPDGWARCWYDISTNIPAAQHHLLLGGEMSMWTDTYCYTGQCGASSGTPVGAPLFPPTRDAEFAKSVGGMIWPRGFVAAASFWNYMASLDPSSPDFVRGVWQVNDEVAARGGLVCPTNCSCDQLSACGKPYLTPSASTPVELAACVEPGQDSQRWTLSAANQLQLGAAPSLCLHYAGHQVYPLTVEACADNAQDQWRHNATTAEFIHIPSGACMDVMSSNGSVGSWACGPAGNQPNQHFAFDTSTGNIVSLDTANPSAAAGLCLTVAA